MNCEQLYCAGKLCLSERQANEMLKGAKRNDRKRTGKKIPKRKYYCQACGYYHLTSESEKDYESNKWN